MQLLPRNIPLHLTNPTLPHHPQRLQIASRPREILQCVIHLNSNQQLSRVVEDIDSVSSPGHYKPLSGDFQTIWHPILREVEALSI